MSDEREAGRRCRLLENVGGGCIVSIGTSRVCSRSQAPIRASNGRWAGARLRPRPLAGFDWPCGLFCRLGKSFHSFVLHPTSTRNLLVSALHRYPRDRFPSSCPPSRSPHTAQRPAMTRPIPVTGQRKRPSKSCLACRAAKCKVRRRRAFPSPRLFKLIARSHCSARVCRKSICTPSRIPRRSPSGKGRTLSASAVRSRASSANSCRLAARAGRAGCRGMSPGTSSRTGRRAGAGAGNRSSSPRPTAQANVRLRRPSRARRRKRVPRRQRSRCLRSRSRRLACRRRRVP